MLSATDTSGMATFISTSAWRGTRHSTNDTSSMRSFATTAVSAPNTASDSINHLISGCRSRQQSCTAPTSSRSCSTPWESSTRTRCTTKASDGCTLIASAYSTPLRSMHSWLLAWARCAGYDVVDSHNELSGLTGRNQRLFFGSEALLNEFDGVPSRRASPWSLHCRCSCSDHYPYSP